MRAARGRLRGLGDNEGWEQQEGEVLSSWNSSPQILSTSDLTPKPSLTTHRSTPAAAGTSEVLSSLVSPASATTPSVTRGQHTAATWAPSSGSHNRGAGSSTQVGPSAPQPAATTPATGRQPRSSQQQPDWTPPPSTPPASDPNTTWTIDKLTTNSTNWIAGQERNTTTSANSTTSFTEWDNSANWTSEGNTNTTTLLYDPYRNTTDRNTSLASNQGFINNQTEGKFSVQVVTAERQWDLNSNENISRIVGDEASAESLDVTMSMIRSHRFNSTSHYSCDGFLCLNLYDEASYAPYNLSFNISYEDAFSYLETESWNWEALLLLLVVFAGVMGNVLVCIAITVEKKLQNVTNYFLMSLAIADLFVSLLVMPCCIVHEFMGYWPFGLVMCDIWQVADVMMCTSSIMHMCTISLDRYIGIRNPLKMRNKSRTVVGIKIAVVWMISLMIASPLIFLGVFKPDQILTDGYQCAILNMYFMIYGSLAAFFLPLCIMLVAYSLTIHILHKQAQKCAQKSNTGMRRSTVRRKAGNKKAQRESLLSNRGSGNQSTGSDPRRSPLPVIFVTNGHRTSVEKDPTMNGVNVSKRNQGQRDRERAHPSEMEPLHSDSEEEELSSSNQGLNALPLHRLRGAAGLAMAVSQGHRQKVRTNRQHSNNSTSSEQSLDPEHKPKLKNLIKKHSTAIKVAGLLMAKRDDSTKKEMNTVKTERKAVKVLGTMFALFVLCWAPFFSLNLAMGVCKTCYVEPILFKIFLWLGYLSSTLNPIIYTIFNKNFKRTFVALLTCKHCSCSCRCRCKIECDCERPGRKIRQTFRYGLSHHTTATAKQYRYSTSFLDNLDETKV